MNMDKNTPESKGIRSFLQVIPGFLVGLAFTIWAVPGVPDAAWAYISQNAGQLFVSLGLSTGFATGLIAFVQNKVEDRR